MDYYITVILLACLYCVYDTYRNHERLPAIGEEDFEPTSDLEAGLHNEN